MQHIHVPANATALPIPDLSYEIAEVRALTDALVHIDMNDDELFKRASPYLLRILSDKASQLDRKHSEFEVSAIALRREKLAA